MKTILLAAGNSSRTWPISNKNFLEFCDIPLFIHLLQNAIKGGLQDFIIVGQEDNIQEYKNITKNYNIQASFVIQENLLQGMAGAILTALDALKKNEEVFILGGNDLIEPSIYKKIIQESINIDGGILAKKVSKYFPGGYLNIKNNNQITSIIEKPEEGNEPSSLVNIVAHYFKSSEKLKEKLFSYKHLSYDFYEVPVLQELFQEGVFRAIEYKGLWQAIKYPWHILDMMNVFLKKQKNFIAPTATIKKNVTIKGSSVVISAGVTVFENTVIQGPCFIGKNTIIGNNCLLRNSMIGSDCSIGFNTEIARSFLSKNISTHYAYIGDSVVDEGVNCGAFSCTANLRLDRSSIKVNIKDERVDSLNTKLGAFIGKGAQIGIHAMLMPGTKIAPNELILPGQHKK